MAGFRKGQQLVTIPLVIALGATMLFGLTGCKKTNHAVKPLSNISLASSAAATSTTAAAPATPASGSSIAPPAVPASASVSQPTTAAPTSSAKAGSGCTLISLTSVAKLLGVASIGSATEAVTTLRAPIIAHQGCRYVAGSVGAGWDINTYSTGRAPSEALVAAEISKIPGAKPMTIDGLLAYSVAEQLPTGIQEQVGMYKGDQVVAIISHGKTGAAVALAQLIAAAI